MRNISRVNISSTKEKKIRTWKTNSSLIDTKTTGMGEWRGACAKETFKIIEESNIPFQGPHR